MGAIYRIDIFKIMMRYKKNMPIEQIAKETGFSEAVVNGVIEIENKGVPLK